MTSGNATTPAMTPATNILRQMGGGIAAQAAIIKRHRLFVCPPQLVFFLVGVVGQGNIDRARHAQGVVLVVRTHITMAKLSIFA
jgi:hypothetical protein